MNPYLLPETNPCCIHFSGGRSSGYMLYHILQAYDGKLPENTRVVFANTGREKPETLDFVYKCQMIWDVDIAWVEYEHRSDAKGGRKDPKHWYKRVSYHTAARDGEPFERMIRAKKHLPSVVGRICTTNLKIEIAMRYMRDEGFNQYHSVLGMRGDEPRRIKQPDAKGREKLARVYPLFNDEVLEEDINRFWKEQDFDLGIHSHQGNCDLCFLKGKTKLIQLIRDDPSLADWWIKMEDFRESVDDGRIRQPEILQFNKMYSYKDLLEAANSQLVLDLSEEDEAGGIGCFCTD